MLKNIFLPQHCVEDTEPSTLAGRVLIFCRRVDFDFSNRNILSILSLIYQNDKIRYIFKTMTLFPVNCICGHCWEHHTLQWKDNDHHTFHHHHHHNQKAHLFSELLQTPVGGWKPTESPVVPWTRLVYHMFTYCKGIKRWWYKEEDTTVTNQKYYGRSWCILHHTHHIGYCTICTHIARVFNDGEDDDGDKPAVPASGTLSSQWW